MRRNGKGISTRATGTALLGPPEGQHAPAERPVSHVQGSVQAEISEPALLQLSEELLQTLGQVTQLLHPGTGHRLDAKVLNFFFPL